MAGHSKFKNIMHRKGAQDAKRAKIFTRLGKELSVAVKQGADPDGNARLRAAIAACRAANMPKDNIDKVLKKAETGDLSDYSEIRYEGFGPEGVSIIVEALTTGGLTDWLWKSFAVCFKKVLKDLDIKNLITLKDNAISEP